VDLNNLGILIDRQRRLAETLGLGRRARPLDDDLDRVLDSVTKRRSRHGCKGMVVAMAKRPVP